MNEMLFRFSVTLCAGRCCGKPANFADCGLGKTPMQLEWAFQVCEYTGGNAC